MTRDDIIRMATDCRLNRICGPLDTLLDREWGDLHRFAALVAAHEREACAQLCETMAGAVDLQYACRIIAEQIRART